MSFVPQLEELGRRATWRKCELVKLSAAAEEHLLTNPIARTCTAWLALGSRREMKLRYWPNFSTWTSQVYSRSSLGLLRDARRRPSGLDPRSYRFALCCVSLSIRPLCLFHHRSRRPLCAHLCSNRPECQIRTPASNSDLLSPSDFLSL